MERGLLNLVAKRSDALVDFIQRVAVAAFSLRQIRSQFFEVYQAFSSSTVLVIILHVTRERVEAGERRRENHAGVVAHVVRKAPTVGKLGSLGRGLVVHHHRYSGIAKRVDTSRDGELRHQIQGLQPVFRKSEVAGQIEVPTAGGQFDNFVDVVDRLETPATVIGFDQSNDVFVGHAFPNAVGYRADKLSAIQNPLYVGVVEYLFHTWKPDRCARHDHVSRPGRGHGVRGYRRRTAGVHVERAVEKLGEHAPQFHVLVLACDTTVRHLLATDRRRCSARRGLWRCSRGRQNGCVSSNRLFTHSEAGCVEAAQRLVERLDVADARVVGEQRDDIFAVTYHIRGETVQCPLGAKLYEQARPGVVQGVESFDELHWRGDLTGENVDHFVFHAGSHRVEFAGDVGHHRYSG